MNGYFLSKQETFNVNVFILFRKNADIYVSVDNLFFPVLFFDDISAKTVPAAPPINSRKEKLKSLTMLLYERGHPEQVVLPEITCWDVPRGRNEAGVLYTSRLQAWLSLMGQIGQGVDFQIKNNIERRTFISLKHYQFSFLKWVWSHWDEPMA